MGSRRRLITIASSRSLPAFRASVQLTSVLACALVAGCKAKEAAPDAEPPPPQVLPVDRLAPGELPEGKEQAFGLVLPEGLRIARGFTGVIHARSTTLQPEPVANYFRARVTGGTVSAGVTETRFTGVHARSEPNRELGIEIRAGAPGDSTCEVLLRDITPPPVEPGLSTEERMRKAGLTPDGKLLDPKHLE